MANSWSAAGAPIDDAQIRARAVQPAGSHLADRYVRFEFKVARAAATMHADEQPVRQSGKRTTSA
ncbi:MAG: hypothetical protein HC822_26690 [Oscillochloris sp.]|nr:hypothetical protein [Oscillochloris sp.]